MNDSNIPIDFTFKVVVAGNSGVGKTNIILRYVEDIFKEDTTPTIGVDFQKKQVEVDEKKINIQFWDTVGQEKLKAIANSYYKNADGAILVYDVCDQKSFDQLNYWIEEIQNHSPQDTKIILVGNKTDLVEQRIIPSDKGLEWAKEKSIFFMEVSAKTNEDECVNKAFTILFQEILKEMIINQEKNEFQKQKQTIRNTAYSNIELNKQLAQLRDEESKRPKQKKCC